MSTSVSPMMKQYQEAKTANPDAMLLFRMGDFFELFHEDAKNAGRILNIAVTSRDKGHVNPVPMAGFPHHQLESYLCKLVSAGMRVAICDQVEDAKQAKGLVRREVTRIVSAGTLTDDALLDPRESNYLVGMVLAPMVGLAWVELSTGQFNATSVPLNLLADELSRISPVECLVAESTDQSHFNLPSNLNLTLRPDWAFGVNAAQEALNRHFGTLGLDGFGFDLEQDTAPIQAAGAVIDYLAETQKAQLAHISRLVPYRSSDVLQIDESTRRSLEITRTIRGGSRDGSLLETMDRTATPMGSRLLNHWISSPLAQPAAIELRLDAVEEFVAEPALCTELRERLKGVYDIERLLARVITGRASPRDLSYIGRTVACLPAVKAKLTARRSELVNRLEAELDLCVDLRQQLDTALADDCPLSTREGGYIRQGFHPELDTLRELGAGGKKWIASYQAAESQRTGIPNLKVGYNKVFGYYLEITSSHSDKIPETYIRKQTIKNAERYITPELKEYEEKILSADEKSQELEYQIFIGLRDKVVAEGHRLQHTASILAQLDVLLSLAELAREQNYCRPKLVDEPVLQIVDGRHPVLDLKLPPGTFVPNDVHSEPSGSQISLITGPNMAGKSTYIRQIALITLMAQVGSFVPAKEAVIGVADRIFARVGASDELSRGHSTFMVEMTETARILNTATAQSLVILDEIGRGTSTYDGVSLAWAIVEYLHDKTGCRTFFATHYHELADLAKSLTGITNLNVAVREWDDQVVFLHKIIEGAADKSYGIHVARLAGVPKEVNERAKQILAQLEQDHLDTHGQAKIAQRGERPRGDLQLSLFSAPDHPLIEKIRGVDINSLTPLEALQTIKAWQDQLKSE